MNTEPVPERLMPVYKELLLDPPTSCEYLHHPNSARKLRIVWYHAGAMRQFCYWSGFHASERGRDKRKVEG